MQRNRNATPQFIGAMAEMVTAQISKAIPLMPEVLDGKGTSDMLPCRECGYRSGELQSPCRQENH